MKYIDLLMHTTKALAMCLVITQSTMAGKITTLCAAFLGISTEVKCGELFTIKERLKKLNIEDTGLLNEAVASCYEYSDSLEKNKRLNKLHAMGYKSSELDSQQNSVNQTITQLKKNISDYHSKIIE